MSNKYRNFTFTVNNYTEDDISKLQSLSSTVRYLVYGKEVGDAGTPHLQGFVSFNNPRKFDSVRKLVAGHIEIARNPPAAALYCKKDGDFFECGVSPVETKKRQGKRTDLHDLADAIREGETDRKKLRAEHPLVCARYPNFVTQLIIDELPIPIVEHHSLRPWQIELNEILKRPPDDREIIFVIDKKGNAGKSWYVKQHRVLYQNSINILPGKKADMIYAVMSMLTPELKTVFLDCPRSKQGEYIQYDFLEDLKNGEVFNTKYESRMLQFRVPHVVVMMNESPDDTKLSDDRYKRIYTV